MEPRIFEDQLWLGGMPGTLKFRDLSRDPGFVCTPPPSTARCQIRRGRQGVGSGPRFQDKALHQRYAEDLFEQTGFDLRDQESETQEHGERPALLANLAKTEPLVEA